MRHDQPSVTEATKDGGVARRDMRCAMHKAVPSRERVPLIMGPSVAVNSERVERILHECGVRDGSRTLAIHMGEVSDA